MMLSKLKLIGGDSGYPMDQGGSTDQGGSFDTDWAPVPDPAADEGVGGWGDSSAAPDFIIADSKSGGSTAGTTTMSGAATGATTVATTGSGLVINLTWDTSVGSAPAAFQTDVVAAVQFIESLITTSATVNLTVGYGEVGGYSMSGGALGESISYLAGISYSSLVADLKATASTDATDAAMVASLPATDPTGANNYWLTTAQAKALGAISANATGTDGSVGFATSNYFSYGDTNTAGTVAAGTYDFFATVVHEITETMGRINLVGSTSINGSAAYGLMDLTHYSAPGVRQLIQSNGGFTDPGGYASPDGGTTNIDNFNAVSGGDPGDLAQPTADSLNAFANSGVLEPFSNNDATLMDMIGWNVAGSSSPPPPPPPPPQAPTGVAITPVTSSLAALQGSTGLTAGRPMAQNTETGGVSGDAFSYSLGGTGAGAFTLSSSGGLGTGGSVVTGAAGGKLYALTITAHDTTNGTSSPAVPVNVVVGTASATGGDTINLSAISGIVTSAPSFIYGLTGNDTLNGTGMSGPLFFDGGAGADVMTGGSGANRYEYGATSDSTASAMDIITNFNVALDTIDLTGIGTHLSKTGALGAAATSIGARSVGWQNTGGNTVIYVNTSAKTEVLGKANMAIEMQGSIALASGNILHA